MFSNEEICFTYDARSWHCVAHLQSKPHSSFNVRDYVIQPFEILELSDLVLRVSHFIKNSLSDSFSDYEKLPCCVSIDPEVRLLFGLNDQRLKVFLHNRTDFLITSDCCEAARITNAHCRSLRNLKSAFFNP